MSAELTPIVGGGTTGLCTRDQVRERLGIKGTEDDERIDNLILALNPVVMARYRREFMPQATATRIFRVEGYHVSLGAYDLRTATTVTLAPGETNAQVLALDTGYCLLPIGADDLTQTYNAIRLASDTSFHSDFMTSFGWMKVSIAGNWGCYASSAAVPHDLREAAIETVTSWLRKPVASITGVQLGAPRESQPPAPMTWDIPIGAHRKFERYERKSGAH